MTLIRVTEDPLLLDELEAEGSFAHAMQQAEDIRRNAPGRHDRRQRVRVVIAVSNNNRRWMDWEEFWSGYWRPSVEFQVPKPDRKDLLEACRRSGCRFATYFIRSVI